MTAHNKAKIHEIANIVLMPGDPLRAKWIAENFLENSILINDVRGMLAYTGTYEGKKITVMGHGMGNPSIGIYSYELFKFYNVDLIIRIGSAGSYTSNVKIHDIFLVNNAYSDSTYADSIEVHVENKTIPAWKEINKIIIDTAVANNIEIKQGTAHASDVFYASIPLEDIIKMSKSEVVEMESFALFANAIKLNKKAACILTCSDSLITHESMSPNERQTSFVKMVTLALKAAKNFE